ncbi:MAG: glycine cleavage T C-terminal barrel domain-containing protein [Acidobacteriota bacterium]
MQLTKNEIESYNHIRSGGGAGFIELPRGLIAVWGKEAVQFLDGMITNDMKTLGDGQQMLAAFPNAQGRLLAVIRVLRQGERFLIETEEATREKVFNNLFRFTFAGDFFVEDLSGPFEYFEVFGEFPVKPQGSELSALGGGHIFAGPSTVGYFIPADETGRFRSELTAANAVKIEDEELYETLRIESGIPKYGVDMDETTIVPELGLDGLISYTKGCYIGQEIIARIHFRGHVAKQLTGIVAEPGAAPTGLLPGGELSTSDGKNCGKITSVSYSTRLERMVALAFVRYDYLAQATELASGGVVVKVKELPLV